MIVYYEGKLSRVISIEHITPGNKRGMVMTKLKDLTSGSMFDVRFRAGDMVDVATLEKRDMEYLYREGDHFVFMDLQNYEQLPFSPDTVGEAMNFLLPNTQVTVDFCDDKPTAVYPPNAVSLTVVDTDPPLSGATASASKKPAKLETGLVVQVPQFVVSGEKIVVDTRDSTFLQRSKE